MTRISTVSAKASILNIERLTPTIGAYVNDVDLADVSNPLLREALKAALADYQVLFFRDQTLTTDQQIDVARVFGDPDKAKAYFKRHEQKSVIELIEAIPGARPARTDQWHADITFSDNPPTGTVLYARELPPLGGDTLWASATRAYDLIAPELQAYLETLQAVHSIEHSGWPDHFLAKPNGEELYRQARAERLPTVHPVVRTHPVTGRKILYVNPNFTSHIKGLQRPQSDALLSYLFSLFNKPDVQVRLRWQPNTVAIWDNRATLHYAVSDYIGEYRLLHRVTFGEDQAF
ncbi:TauD/TfdA dioxygenase family protein [Insolitispirillum peregrinum]|uniref:Taurine dioxygenase n=1 Tax=Insolitispirillum peregrinum TaxID=80876 RepID=A0A1N7IHP1_9PROT|nr:TauD/TfdA family dioxygenase [Insolitispirillum peregrinum]SIS36536.1 taurine dioxygenase [Insolitispirillum peregrinum]